MIFFIGIGRGDPGLLAVRAAQAIANARAVVYDADLDVERVLELAREDAERLPLERELARDPSSVARALAALSTNDGIVVRLGYGFLPARWAEEARALEAMGVSIELVAGVPVSLAAAVSAGIPLPLSLQILSTVAREAVGSPATIALEGAPLEPRRAADLLEAAGMAPDTPIALIDASPLARVRTERITLSELQRDTQVQRGSTVILAGDAAREPAVGWYESKPLFGRRVVVTRARAQAAGFVAALEREGAEVIAFPAIRVVPPADSEPLRRAVREVSGYDWVVFTSANGVERFWAALAEEGLDARAFGGVRIACIGPATAGALAARGMRADIVPPTYIAESVVEAMRDATELRGRRVLLPRAAGARSVLPAGLAALGAMVDDVEAYRSIPETAGAAELRRRLAEGEIDVVTFTSSSTVTSFVDAVGPDLGGALVAAIGPITAETARRLGLVVAIEASEHTIPGLLAALRKGFAAQSQSS